MNGTDFLSGTVIPAKAGIQVSNNPFKKWFTNWIPAFAGMTASALVCSTSIVFAASSSGKGVTAFPFLKIPIASRAAALGSAYTAVPGDITAIEYNPAGLTDMTRTDINLSYISYVEDTSLQSAAIGFPVSSRETGRPLNVEGIQLKSDRDRFFCAFQYRSLKTNDTARNNVGAKTGEFDIHNQLFHLAGAYSPVEPLSFGFAAKIISGKIADNSIKTYAGDIGVLYKATNRLSFGSSILNLGSGKAYVAEKDPMPTSMRIGAAWNNHRGMLLTSDVTMGNDKIPQASAGAEFNLGSNISLRAGTLYNTTIEFTGGLGVRFNNPLDEQTTQVRTEKSRRKILYDLDIPESSPAYKKNTDNFSRPPIIFGLDYAFRTENVLGITHTITLKILY